VITEIKVKHHEHISDRTFEDVVDRFEAAVGSVEDDFDAVVEGAGSLEEFEGRVRSREGSSGFMRFLTVDHGAWLALIGMKAKSRMYTIGNPLIARTMLTHELAAGLNVPVRLMIYEHAPTNTVRLAYDLPSSLMSGLHNDEATAAATKLDAKLEALAQLATGAVA
jgi:uncharacterized protein (DUF302 family)